MTIVKRWGKFYVLSKRKQNILGIHDTRVQALKQLRAIELSKMKRKADNYSKKK
jgi:hypothetical protein